MAFFNLFIVLPNEQVCTLRKNMSGTTVHEIRSKLELVAGLPSQLYKLSGKSGQILYEDYVFELGLNVWDGFLLRAELRSGWQLLVDAVCTGNLDWLLQDGQIQLKKNVILSHEEKDEALSIFKERATVALYLASWRGEVKICKGLLRAGVDPNGVTPYNRTPLFAAVAGGNDNILEILLNQGASLSVRDLNNDTPLDVARRNFAKRCISRIRSLQLKRLDLQDNGRETSKMMQNRFSHTPLQDNIENDASKIHSSRTRPFTAREGQNEGELIKDRTVSGFCFPKRSVSFEITREPESSIPKESDVGKPDSCRSISTTLNSNNDILKTNYNFKITQPVNTLGTSGSVQFRIPRLPSNSPRRSSAISQEVVIWNDLMTYSKSVPKKRKGHLLQNTIHSSSTAALNCTIPVKIDLSKNSDQDLSSGTNNSDAQNPASGNTFCEDETSQNVSSLPNVNNGPDKSDKIDDDSIRNKRNVPPRIDCAPVFRRTKIQQKQAATLKAAMRRIQLTEHNRRTSSTKDRPRKTFDEWLKIKQAQKNETSSDDDSDDRSNESKQERNSKAFETWLKKIQSRPKPRQDTYNPHAASPGRKQGLIRMETFNTNQSEKVVDTFSYIHALKDWQRKQETTKPKKKIMVVDADEAKRLLEEKRQQILAMAITFNEWMTLNEEKKQLMKVIQRANVNKLQEIERHKCLKRTSKSISKS